MLQQIENYCAIYHFGHNPNLICWSFAEFCNYGGLMVTSPLNVVLQGVNYKSDWDIPQRYGEGTWGRGCKFSGRCTLEVIK